MGANPDASKYAGMSVERNIVLVMALSGALAGLAGTTQVLGVDHWVGAGFSAGYGFDSIALALLGKSHPLGRGTGIPAVRHAAQRRDQYAVSLPHPDRYYLGHPGHGDHFRCRARHHPLDLPHPLSDAPSKPS